MMTTKVPQRALSEVKKGIIQMDPAWGASGRRLAVRSGS